MSHILSANVIDPVDSSVSASPECRTTRKRAKVPRVTIAVGKFLCRLLPVKASSAQEETMADQTQTTANKQSEPTLCKMGCGFFGNGATNNCCSKCWGEHLKKEAADSAPPATAKPTPAAAVPAPREEPEPMVCEPITTTEVIQPVEEAPKKKKKKKTSYKNMMKALTKASPERDVEQEKEQLRKVTGGGNFSKIEKI